MISKYSIVVQNKVTQVKYLYRIITDNITKTLCDLSIYNNVLDYHLYNEYDDRYLFEYYKIEFENIRKDRKIYK
jgi:hypothetical protein